ncbi:MAG: RDD family protein [Acholeplasmatales bacterium]|nr:RDD family protein [Acholeplasmatales bacterium]
MNLYIKASSIQRFLAYAIDIALITILAYIFTLIVLNISPYDMERYNELSELITDKMDLYVKENSTENFIDYIGRSEFNEFIKLSMIQFLIQMIINIVFVALYLVVLPYFWEKQTVGRLVAKIKVIRHTGDIKCGVGNLLRREMIGTLLFYLLLGPFSILVWISALVASLKGRSVVDYIGNTDLVMYNPVTVDPEMMNNQNMNYFNNQNNPYKNDNYKDDAINAEIKDIKDGDETSDDSEDDYIVI